MVPPILTEKLAGVRTKEKLQRFAWGLCRVLAVALIVFLVACLADWVIDRFQETPQFLRVVMLISQVLLAAVLVSVLVVMPISRKLNDDQIALWVEQQNPRFQNRLISAVQLNREGAWQQGMSRELIGVVTAEAEQQAQRVDFGKVIDNRRLMNGLLFLVPAIVIFALPFVIWPSVFPILVSRQFLADREIPRSVYLDQDNREVWPKGEVVRLEIKATGPGVDEETEGELVIDWERSDLSTTRVPLRRTEQRTGEHRIYTAEIPASSVNFHFTAWIGDGRLRQPGQVRYEPRPEVQEEAFVLLPDYCGRTPGGRPYVQPASRGEVEGLGGSKIRIEIQTQKPVKSASVLLTSGEASRAALGFGGALIAHPDHREPITLAEDGQSGFVVFHLVPVDFPTRANAIVRGLTPVHPLLRAVALSLPPERETRKQYAPWSQYSIQVVDEYEFDNQPQPVRGLRVIREPRPEVALLREQLPPESPVDPRFADLYVHTGMPAREGEKIRVAYKAFGQYGLGAAYLEYRKVARTESGNDEVKEDDWTRLPLPEETRINPKTGKDEDLGAWLPDQGVFAKTPPDRSVPFFPVPSPHPEKEMGRITGGGRYDLDLRGLITPSGMPLKLTKGDQLEYRVRVLSASGAKDNVSEIRVTSIEDSAGVWQWLTTTWAEQDRIRSLEKSQRGIFEKGK